MVLVLAIFFFFLLIILGSAFLMGCASVGVLHLFSTRMFLDLDLGMGGL
jgi:hypothetical protein